MTYPIVLDENPKQEFACVKIFGMDALFTDLRVSRKDFPVELYQYELRDDCDGEPNQVKQGILVNFFGTLIMKEPIPGLETPDDGRDIISYNDLMTSDDDKDEDFYYTNEYMTLNEFLGLDEEDAEEPKEEKKGGGINGNL